MLAVFLSFATAEVTSLRVFGVGLAVAVTLEATLVRLVLLPALLRLLGRRAWWPLTSAVEREHGRSLPAAGPQPAIPGQISAPPCSS
jgi:RND superfamily putative drug exporter